MTKKEFEIKTGLKVSDGQYKRIEDMYMNTGNLDKDEFCYDYLNHSESAILNHLADYAEQLKTDLTKYVEAYNRMADLLIDKAEYFADDDMRDLAIELLGKRAYIQKKISLDIDFCDKDKELISELLNK